MGTAELVKQYESEAERLKERINAVDKQIAAERKSEALRKLRRLRGVLDEEYREIIGDIFAMRKGTDANSEEENGFRYVRKCLYCGRPFRTNYSQKVYCSSRCQLGSKVGVCARRKCKNCGAEFIPSRPNQFYCSSLCQSRYNARKYYRKHRGQKTAEGGKEPND